MALLFISHSSRDHAATSYIRDRLRAEGFQALFLDFDPQDGIPAGRDWERELYSALRRSDALIFLSSPSSVASHWCFAEVALARSIGKPIFPITIAASPRHPLLGDIQGVDLWSKGEAALTDLVHALRRGGLDPADSLPWRPGQSPYPGLEPFEEQDAAVFFGRAREIRHLQEMLTPTMRHGAGRFVAVVGPSGTGKTSLVRAGLVPRLRRLANRWVVIPSMTPGVRPIGQLSRSLSSALREHGFAVEAAELEQRLTGPGALGSCVSDVIEASRPTNEIGRRSALLVIDQAEELLTRTGPLERQMFLDRLKEAFREEAALWVVATLRSEFLGSAPEHAALAEAVDDVLMLGPLDQSRLFEVIERPAARAGIDLEPGLAGRMVSETAGGDALPLLAYTLRRLTDSVPNGTVLRIADYEAIGGVIGALQRQADRVAELLAGTSAGPLVLSTLTKLASVESAGEPTRRFVPRRRLSREEDAVIQAFVEARLVTVGSAGDEHVVAVAHEALLRRWVPLRNAIEEQRDVLRFRTELEQAADDWARSGRKASYLLIGERLMAAVEWAEVTANTGEDLAAVHGYIRASSEQDRLRLRQAADDVAQRMLQELDRAPDITISLGLAAIDLYGPVPSLTAALSKALARPHVHLQVPGVRLAWSPSGSRIVTAGGGKVVVWDATTGDELATLAGRDGEGALAWSPDGSRILMAPKDGKQVAIWSVDTGVEISALRDHEGPVVRATWSPDGTRILTVSEGQFIRIWDASTGQVVRQLHPGPLIEKLPGRTFMQSLGFGPGSSGPRTDAVWSPDGGQVAAVAENSVWIWDAVTGRRRLHSLMFSTEVKRLSWSPDGRHLAIAADKQIRVYDASHRDRPGRLVTRGWRGPRTDAEIIGEVMEGIRGWVLHDDRVTDVAWSPDGTRIASACWDRTAKVCNTNELSPLTGGYVPLAILGNHRTPVQQVAWSPDGTRIATASDTEGVQVWDCGAGFDLKLEIKHSKELKSAVWSPDGTKILTVEGGFTPLGSGTQVQVWEAATGRLLTQADHRRKLRDAAWSPDSTRIVTTTVDVRTAEIWDARSGAKLLQLDGPIVDPPSRRRKEDEAPWFVGVDWSPTGDRIATVSSGDAADGTLRVWDANTGGELLTVRYKGDEPCRMMAVSWAPDGSRIASISHRKENDGYAAAQIWDAASGELLLDLRASDFHFLLGGHPGVAWAPDGACIIASFGNSDGTAAWDTTTGAEVTELCGLEGSVSRTAFSRDGSRVVTSIFIGEFLKEPSVRVWDAAIGLELMAYRAHIGFTNSAGWSPDGSSIVTASSNGTARIWGYHAAEELLKEAARHVWRYPNPAQRRQFGLPDR